MHNFIKENKCLKLKKSILITIGVILGCILIFSLGKIYFWQKDYQKTNEIINEVLILRDQNKVDFKDLKSKNPDSVAWLSVAGTEINYPVVQTKDNNYYLKHSFDKSYNQAGWIFADYRNNMKNLDKNTIIYGHAFLIKIMFGTLKNTLEQDWYSNPDNHFVRLTTEDETTTWEVFSTYRIKTTDDYLAVSFNNDTEFNNFVDLVKNRSIHRFENIPNFSDKIITLSTCYNLSERVVVHAKLIEAHDNN